MPTCVYTVRSTESNALLTTHVQLGYVGAGGAGHGVSRIETYFLRKLLGPSNFKSLYYFLVASMWSYSRVFWQDLFKPG